MQKNYISVLGLFFLIVTSLGIAEQSYTQKKETEKTNLSNPQEKKTKKSKRPPFQFKIYYEGLFASNDFSQHNVGFKANIWMGNLGSVNFLSIINSSFIITEKESNHYFPENLYDLNYQFLVRSNKLFIHASISSASDKPFHSKDEISYFTAGFWKIIAGSGHHFSLGIVYSSSPLIEGVPKIPLPFFWYMYQSPNFRLMLGIENMLHWLPSNYLQFKINVPIDGEAANFQIISDISKNFSITAIAKMGVNRYLIADRADKDLYLTMSKKEAGLQFQATFDFLTISVYGGYAFDIDYYLQEIVPLGGYRDKLQLKELADAFVCRLDLSAKF